MKTQLRVHPKVTYHGARTWPPGWGGAYGPGTDFPLGEQGILREVSIVDKDYIGPRRLELVIDFRGQKHVGQLWVDDPEVVTSLYGILRTRIGRPIGEIGEMTVDL